jgi:hypothetical protein
VPPESEVRSSAEGEGEPRGSTVRSSAEGSRALVRLDI